MIEAIFEGIVWLITAIVKLIGMLFINTWEFLCGGEIIIAFFSLLLELFIWFVFSFAELVSALFERRRPKKVKKPKYWQSKKKKESRDCSNN